MQSVSYLKSVLENIATGEHCVFSRNDLKVFLEGKTEQNINMILSRSVKNGFLKRICSGVFLYKKAAFDRSAVLPKVAMKLRAGKPNYISMESVLCEEGIISQQMMNWLVVMTGGRSGIIDCGEFGSVEFIHTQKKLYQIANNIHLDTKTGMFKANVRQAYRDMVSAKRTTLDLVDTSLIFGDEND